MVELLGIFWLTRLTSRLAVSKGYSRWFAAYVPLMWVTAEVTVMFFVQASQPETNIYVLMFIGVGAGAVGGSAVYWNMRKRAPRNADAAVLAPGAAAAQAPPSRAAVNDRQALVGYCEQCGANAWLTPEGACEKGHGPESVSGVYWALRQD